MQQRRRRTGQFSSGITDEASDTVKGDEEAKEREEEERKKEEYGDRVSEADGRGAK